MDLSHSQIEALNLNILIGDLNVKVISLVVVNPYKNWYVSEHQHYDYEFHMIPSGRGYINIEGRSFEVNGGEFYITGPNVIHEQKTDPVNPMGEYCLECEINVAEEIPNNYINSNDETKAIIEILAKPFAESFKDEYDLPKLFEQLFIESENKRPGYYLKIKILITEILLAFFRNVCKEKNIKNKHYPVAISLDDIRVNKLIKFIEYNYCMNISLKDASGILFLSARQINRLMIKRFGCTFHEYLMQFRLKSAQKMLTDTEFSIELIAEKAGYKSHHYMYQAFHRAGLETPAKIRAGSRNS